MSQEQASEKTVRLDKWLKVSRLFKTRALATRACTDGRVKVNDQKAKAGRLLKVGDVVTIRHRGKYRTFETLALAEKNVSKEEARSLYTERTPKISADAKEMVQMLQAWDRAGKRKYKGRPTKKERRELDKFRGD